MKMPPLTPEEFAARMKANYVGDTEGDHWHADKLMCTLLKSLGYGEGVKVFEEMKKGYANQNS